MATTATGTATHEYYSVWHSWNQTSGAIVTTTYTTGASTAWIHWNNTWWSANATVTTTTATPWMGWNGQYVQAPYHLPYREIKEPTAEELEARRVAAERRRQIELEAKAAREAAQKKAQELLIAHLAPSQKEQYQKERHFDVISRDGKRRYRVTHGYSGNVFLMSPENKRLKSYCIHPQTEVPTEDNLLAQKLLLEYDEERFLRVANASTF